MSTSESPVIVIGAGPVGMAAALLLARQGIRTTVVERRGTPSCGQSRAVTVQRDILALFDRLGVAEEILRDGASWSLGRTYYGEHELLQLRFPTAEHELYPPFVNFPQFRTEELLHAAAEASELVRFRHGFTVTEVVDEGGSVLVRAESSDGEEVHRGQYVIAADGLGSRVRGGLGIAYEGWQTEGRFLVCDFVAELPFSRERRLWFDPPFHPGRIVLMHGFGPDRWRVDWQIEPDADEADYLARLDELLRGVIGDHEALVLRANSYTFQQRCAERFGRGRVFLVGDAAHVVSPFGARGMNSGMEDAENLAWKLGFVLAGRADATLLDTYDQERRAAAEHHVEVTGATMRFMTPATAEGIANRDAILAGAVTDATKLSEVDSGRLYESFPYRDSTLTASGTGALVADGSVNGSTLRKLLAGDISLLVIPGATSTIEDVAARLAAATAVHSTRRFLLLPRGSAAPDNLEVTAVHDDTGALTTALAADTDRLLLVRPDCYVGADVPLPATGRETAALVHECLRTVLGQRTETLTRS
ncbi:FAD-dependent oxidoreductase [Actinokineospora sp. NBRC 105648]|uniref:FAD-dependent oxidoreductase n=1 Tax=Actinokineospora sp. NBRC 105648 TaxID=3032206 RepID=UPI0024A5ED0B|nr:FAD-dependent oxidoreductase [Actinokineospora sp. NBRC 105648]GLZ43763.1 oxidoreductase [Actinokineospora sp. NBRC 105648]